MRKPLMFTLVVAVIGLGLPAGADMFGFDLAAQVGYAQLHKIERPFENAEATLAGGVVGVRAKLEIMFISAIVDYQHFFDNADYLHAGLGIDFKLPTPVIEPFIRGSVGLMFLSADKSMFDPAAETDLERALGFQLRGGVGLDIPLGSWFAIGAAGDVGYHYMTGRHGWDFSVVGYLGLRV